MSIKYRIFINFGFNKESRIMIHPTFTKFYMGENSFTKWAHYSCRMEYAPKLGVPISMVIGVPNEYLILYILSMELYNKSTFCHSVCLLVILSYFLSVGPYAILFSHTFLSLTSVYMVKVYTLKLTITKP